MAVVGSAGLAQPQLIWEAPAVTGWREAESIEVHGTMDNGVFRPDSVAIPQPPGAAAPPLIPLGENLLGLAQVRPFGIEERVAIRQEGGRVVINCRQGSAPAGLVLRWPGYRLPVHYRGQWVLKGSSEGVVGVSPVRTGEDAPDIPGGYWRGAGVNVAFPDQQDQALILACPADGASAILESVTLASAENSELPVSRGTWVWREDDWRPDPESFAKAAAAAGFTELAIQVPLSADAVLTQLVHALEEQRIAVRFLDGDPAMATPEGLERTLAKIGRLRSWLTSHRISQPPMLELDIEPYGQASFAADPAAGWRGWAIAVQKLAATWGAPVAVDVPWWMQSSTAAATALSSANSSIAEFVVMAYRTEPRLILDAAEPWFDSGKPVQVAIETGPVAVEVTQTYRRAKRGTLRLSDAAAVLLPSAQEAGPGQAVYRLEAQLATNSARVSFHHAPDRALEVEGQLLPILRGWPSFAGFRLHGWSMTASK